MPLNTASKRGSAFGWGVPSIRTLPLPGSIDQGDRQHVALMYSGILAAEAETVPLGPFDYTLRFFEGRVDVRMPPPKRRLRGKVGRES